MQLTKKAAIATVSAVVTASIVLNGCSNGSSTTATSADVAAMLKSASEAAQKVTSTHFTVDVTGKVPNMPITKVDGDLQVKPVALAHGTATIDIGGKSEGEFVFIDGHMYASLLGDKYADYGDGKSIYDVSALFDPAKGIPNILSKVRDPKTEGTETVDGTETTKITGTVPATEVSAISGSRVAPDKNFAVPTTTWIRNTGDKQLVRIRIKPSDEGSVTLTFSKWGEQVSATKPDVPAVEITPNPGGEGKSRPQK